MPNELRYHWNQRQILDSGLENPKKCDFVHLLHRPTPPQLQTKSRSKSIGLFAQSRPLSPNVETPSSPSNLTKCTVVELLCFVETAWPEKKTTKQLFFSSTIQQSSSPWFWDLGASTWVKWEFRVPRSPLKLDWDPMNTHSTKRCIWGWWIRVASQKYHQFPSENWQWTCKKIRGFGVKFNNYASHKLVKVGRMVTHQPSKAPFPARHPFLRPKPHMTSSQSTKAPAAWHRAMTSRNLEKRGWTGNLITRWWFQPIWKILVKLDHFPR